MFKMILKYGICGVVEVEIYKNDGTLLKIKRCKNRDEALSVVSQLKKIGG